MTRALAVAVCGASVACALACAAAKEATSTPVADGPVVYRLPDRPLCTKGYADPDETGTVGDDELVEASGLVASPTHANVLWSHNDHGDEARVFAIAADGTALGRVKLDVDNEDIEDIAMAPCPDLQGPCIYLADTGNNDFDRTKLFVYAFPEPDVEVDKPLPAGTTAAKVWTFPIVMPSPATNIEAMAITPGATEMIFIEKDEPSARIFALKAPWTPDVDAELQETATFDPPGVDVAGGHLVTGADMHPSAQRLALRTYTGVWEVVYGEGAPLDVITEDQLVEVFLGPRSEPQGEAIAYDLAGTGMWTVSESLDDAPQPLHHAACQE